MLNGVHLKIFQMRYIIFTANVPFAASDIACGMLARHVQKVLQSRENGPVAVHLQSK
jgi:hypothetical protein